VAVAVAHKFKELLELVELVVVVQVAVHHQQLTGVMVQLILEGVAVLLVAITPGLRH
jgi:hypothetical protein